MAQDTRVEKPLSKKQVVKDAYSSKDDQPKKSVDQIESKSENTKKTKDDKFDLTRAVPWPVNKGEPSDKLANYDKNVGVKTPVGRYPDGATPEGLMDMAGNVWEWMENRYEEDSDWRALRGGSWFDTADGMRCSARVNLVPDLRLQQLRFSRCACPVMITGPLNI